MVVNGSWTQAHINSFLSSSSQASIVYPPCDTKSLCSLPLETRLSSSVVSLAQFRPEKEQTLQVKMLKALFDLDGDYRSGSGGKKKVILTLMGSCRNQGDEDRIAGLKNLSRELGIEVSSIQPRLVWHFVPLTRKPFVPRCDRTTSVFWSTLLGLRSFRSFQNLVLVLVLWWMSISE